MNLLFVYGTLKGAMHQWKVEARYLGTARTTSDYTLFQEQFAGKETGFPAMVQVTEENLWGSPLMPKKTSETDNDKFFSSVWGELWEVSSELLETTLDEYEVAPVIFDRRNIRLSEVHVAHLPRHPQVMKMIDIKVATAYLYQKPFRYLSHVGSFWEPKEG